MTIRSGYHPASSSSSLQPWSQLSSPSTYSLPLSSTCCHGNFSIMVIGIVPWGSSFSIFMQSLSVYATQVHIYAHAPPPRRRAIYREFTTPENDGNAEVEPISTADMTSPPHTQRSVSIYVSSDGVCVFLTWRWSVDFHLACLPAVRCVHVRVWPQKNLRLFGGCLVQMWNGSCFLLLVSLAMCVPVFYYFKNRWA